ncbi:MAG: adenylate/guanylate cyclase domain-containing protein [Alphaproteobacteria bacterium]|nr:adenylate/guanylate cyclase domain-containing protein [Alphaproteobacteria bacterium]
MTGSRGKGAASRALGIVRKALGGGRMVGLVILVGLVALRVADPLPLRMLREKTFDLYQIAKPRTPPPQRIVSIVDIDEKSLGVVGQWPWPRTVVADMVSRLLAMGAVAVGFDIVFAEPDRSSPSLVAKSLPGLDEETRAKLSAMETNDTILAEALKGRPVVLGMTATSTLLPGADAGTKPARSLAFLGMKPEELVLETFPALVRNLPVLDAAGAGHGVFNPSPGTDGIIRQVPMVIRVGKNIYPALSTELLRLATGNNSVAIKANKELGGIQGLAVKRNLIRTDESGRVWVYYSPQDKEKYVSAADILAGTAPVDKIAGRIVLIGTSAEGLKDLRSTPLDRFIPGVEIHAQILETVLSGSQLQRPRDALVLEVLAAFLAGFLMVVMVPLLGARWTLAAFLAVSGSLGALSWYAFDRSLTLYDPVYPILVALMQYMYLSYSNYAREEAQRRQVRGAFSRYMSPALVEKLAQDPGRLKLGGEMRDMTLLFCDVRGFTTISESFGKDAEGLTRLINRFLTPLTDMILSRQGTIDKYMGDCIMAFWNAPLDDDDHARHACDSALAMQHGLKDVNATLEGYAKEEGRRHIPINIGIGLNSGEVCVGNMGSEQRFDYSVLGDNVNLASRLEGQSKGYHVMTVIGENTRERASDYATLELDLIKVKGKHEAVRIHTLLGDPARAATPEFQSLKVEHDALLAAYRSQDWAGARARLANCRKLDAGGEIAGFYDLYAERIAECEQNPPGSDWDGVYVATSK